MRMNQVTLVPELAVLTAVLRSKLPFAASATDPVHEIQRCLHLPPLGEAGGALEEPKLCCYNGGVPVRAV